MRTDTRTRLALAALPGCGTAAVPVQPTTTVQDCHRPTTLSTEADGETGVLLSASTDRGMLSVNGRAGETVAATVVPGQTTTAEMRLSCDLEAQVMGKSGNRVLLDSVADGPMLMAGQNGTRSIALVGDLTRLDTTWVRQTGASR